MALYTPALGERGDGFCACGQPAVSEIQVGWYNARRAGEESGGQYDEVCRECLREQEPENPIAAAIRAGHDVFYQ